jgi:hypothetical protein
MRLMQICLPLVLGPVMMLAQQTQPRTTPKTTQTSAAKPANATAHPHRTSRRHHRRSQVAAHKRAKRAAYRPDYTENTVEVINGGSTNKVVFHNEAAPPPTAKTSSKSIKNGPQPMKVEVVNGSSTDTQYFYGSGQQQAPVRNKPVVVGIQSSDTRQVGGMKHPVVTGVTAGGTTDAKAAANGGQQVTQSVSPKPKRPDYQPEPH